MVKLIFEVEVHDQKIKSQKYNDNMVLWFLMYKDKRKYQMKLGMKLLFFIRWRKIVKKIIFIAIIMGLEL